MVEFDRTHECELSASPRVKICVAGVGGGGLNVLDRISLDRMMEAHLVSLHTDVRVLSHSMSPLKIQLGAEVMRGIGSGGDPELGRDAAESSREQIKVALHGHDMVFICCGLGGGTGSGAAPVVAEIAKELGAMVFVFATMPFSFEGRRRITQAEVSLERLQNTADALILFENSRMGELILPKEGIQKAFSQADQLIGHSVRAIATMVSQPGIVRMGLSDLMSALRNPNGRCLFGFGEARGNNRVTDALKRALKSPLVNQGLLLQNARNLLVHVSGGESLTLAEVESLMKQLGKYVPEQTQIMFGLAVEPRMGDALSVTLISSLSAQEMALESSVKTMMAPPPVVAFQSEVRQPELAARPVDVEMPMMELLPRPAAPEPEQTTVSLPPVNDLFSLPETLAPADIKAPIAEPSALVLETVETSPEPVVIEQVSLAPKMEMVEPVLVEATPLELEIPEPVQDQEIVAVTSFANAADEEEIAKEQTSEATVLPAPVESVPASTFKSSFSIIDDEDDEEDEETIEDEEDATTHWSEKYSAHQPLQPQAPVVAPRREPVRELEPAMAHAGIKPLADFKQPSLNLHQEEITRFKGTDKTIIEGEDLDVPTWMRLRQKLKR